MVKTKDKKPSKKLRLSLIILSSFVFVLLCSYGTLAYYTQDRAAPKLYFEGKKISLSSRSDIEMIAQKIIEEKKSKKILLKVEDDRQSRTYDELGISYNKNKLVDFLFKYGKTSDYNLPKLNYIISMLASNVVAENNALQPDIDEAKFKQIEDYYQNKKEDPENPKLEYDNGLKITEPKNGNRVSLKDLKIKALNCYKENCSGAVELTSVKISSNIKKEDLNFCKTELEKLASNRLTLTSNWKKFYLTGGDLLKLVDVERTVLNQSLTYSENAIDDYLKYIEPKVNQKSKPKQISSYDNSVISEGQTGTQIDLQASRDAIVDALTNNKKTATLAIETSEPKEEIVNPGFTPGKYPGKYIEVNLAEQNLYMIDGNNILNTFKVSTGKWSMPTPTGEFNINNKDPRAYSQKYALYMPYWMAFIGSEYGIHELPEWPNGAKEGESHLGTPVSHGCVRLGRGSAQTVYDWVEIGTPVYIHR